MCWAQEKECWVLYAANFCLRPVFNPYSVPFTHGHLPLLKTHSLVFSLSVGWSPDVLFLLSCLSLYLPVVSDTRLHRVHPHRASWMSCLPFSEPLASCLGMLPLLLDPLSMAPSQSSPETEPLASSAILAPLYLNKHTIHDQSAEDSASYLPTVLPPLPAHSRSTGHSLLASKITTEASLPCLHASDAGP